MPVLNATSFFSGVHQTREMFIPVSSLPTPPAMTSDHIASCNGCTHIFVEFQPFANSVDHRATTSKRVGSKPAHLKDRFELSTACLLGRAGLMKHIAGFKRRLELHLRQLSQSVDGVDVWRFGTLKAMQRVVVQLDLEHRLQGRLS